MLILSNESNKVLGAFPDGAIVTQIPDQAFPMPEDQIGKNPVLTVDPTTKSVAYTYEDRPLTDSEKQDQEAATQAQIVLALVNGGMM